MTTPHAEDKAGQEAYRKELIEQIRLRGGKVSDSIKLADAKRVYAEIRAKVGC
jgi:hypothetical protein